MKSFTYERARVAGRSRGRRGAASGREVHRRRHQPARPDEARDRDADAPRSTSTASRSTRSRRRRRRAAHRRARAQHRSRRTIRACGAITACSPARCVAGASDSCATWRRPPAICCSARAAPTSTTPTSRATSASQAAAARRSAASAASTRSSARATPASRRIRATWPSRCACSMRRSRPLRPDGARARIPIADFHRLPGDTPHIETVLTPGELITAVTLPKPRRRQAALSQGARPRVVRLRAGVGRRRSSSATAAGAWRSAAWRTSRGASRRPRPRCRGAPGRRRAAARRRAHDPRQRLQAAAGRAHARLGARPRRGAEHEVRQARHQQSDRPAQGGR